MLVYQRVIPETPYETAPFNATMVDVGNFHIFLGRNWGV